MTYDLKNVEKYLNFKVDKYQVISSPPDENHVLTVRDIDLVFRNDGYLANFLYCLKKQTDYGVVHEVSQEPLRIEDLKCYVAFDSSMNVIYTEVAGEYKKFKTILDDFHKQGLKGFWGEYKNDQEVEIVTEHANELCEYSTEKTEHFNKAVIMQKEGNEYDETEVVYVHTEHTPIKSLEISYIFHKYDTELWYTEALKNHWLY